MLSEEISATLVPQNYVANPGAGGSFLGDPATMDGDNTVWQAQLTGDGNFFLNSGTIGAGFENAIKFVNMADNAELRFDLKVLTIDPGTELVVKLDSGWPNVSTKSITVPEVDVWTPITVPFSELIANAIQPGEVNYDKIVNPFVIEPTNNVVTTVQMDNIRIVCPAEAECDMEPIVVSEVGESFDVYVDNALAAGFDIGQWGGTGISPATDAERGTVLEMDFVGDSGVYFSGPATDFSAFAADGNVTFDVKVLEGSGFVTVKVDGTAGATSGDVPLAEQAPTGTWHTFTVPVSSFMAGSLDLSSVTAAFVIFPKDLEAGKIQLDNIRWELPTP